MRTAIKPEDIITNVYIAITIRTTQYKRTSIVLKTRTKSVQYLQRKSLTDKKTRRRTLVIFGDGIKKNVRSVKNVPPINLKIA